MKLRWYRIKRNHKEQLLPEINLTPLIDTALTLLIIFMIATPLSKKDNALLIELPRGTVKETADDMKEDAVVIIDSKGKISFNDVIMDRQKILAHIGTFAQKKEQAVVYVKGDRGVSYGQVVELVDAIKNVQGVHYVALATTKPVV